MWLPYINVITRPFVINPKYLNRGIVMQDIEIFAFAPFFLQFFEIFFRILDNIATKYSFLTKLYVDQNVCRDATSIFLYGSRFKIGSLGCRPIGQIWPFHVDRSVIWLRINLAFFIKSYQIFTVGICYIR